MNPADKTVLSAFKASALAGNSSSKRDQAGQLARKAGESVREPAVRDAVTRLANHLLARPRAREINQPQPFPRPEVNALTAAGLVRSAEFFWTEYPEAIHDLSAEELLATAPGVRVLELATKGHRELTLQASAWLEANPALADASPALDWLTAKAKPTDLARLAPHFLSGRPRPPHLASPAQLLASALKGDKKQEFLRALLSAATGSVPCRHQLETLFRAEPPLQKRLLDALPLGKAPAPVNDLALSLLETLLPEWPRLTPNAREAVGGAVVALVGRLLARQPWPEPEVRLLTALGHQARGWLDGLRDATPVEGLWLTAPATEMLAATQLEAEISFRGARLLADAMDDARTGVATGVLLEVLAQNLRMKPVEAINEIVGFNPKLHEDMVGALLNGDAARVQVVGWQLDERIVQRAKVTPESHA